MERRRSRRHSKSHRRALPPSTSPNWQWPPLIDPRSEKPTEALTRLSDSLAFFLDFCVEPRSTGLIEPLKLQLFFRAVGVEEDKNLGNLPLEIFPAYFQALKVKHKSSKQPSAPPKAGAPSKLKKLFKHETQPSLVPCPALTHEGLLRLLDLNCRRDPDASHVLLSKAIEQFKLLDPLTGNPNDPTSYQQWPALPREALPAAPDPNVVEFYNQAKQVIVQGFQAIAAKSPSVPLPPGALPPGTMQRGRSNGMPTSGMSRSMPAYPIAATYAQPPMPGGSLYPFSHQMR